MLLGLPLGLCAWSGAQSIGVYTEFAQIDKAGKVTAPETPREILSPAVVRNGFTSFQVVVEAPAEAKWWLFVGQNPEKSFKVTMYRESGDLLESVDLPVQSQGTQVFWMDVWTDGRASVQRVKLEPELNINDDWVLYPIEARVVEATAPQGPAPAASTREYICGSPASGAALKGPRLRNSEQDVKLMAAHFEAKEDIKKLLGGCDAEVPTDPEWYLRIRDYLFRLR